MIKVMIVDDEDIVIDDLKNLIEWEKYGFKIVTVATNGFTALNLFEKYNPELMIVDIKMPGMNGLDFCRHVLSRNVPVKILLLTAYKDFEFAKEAISIGISNYLLKHEIDEKTLLSELQKVGMELENDSKRLQIIRNQVFEKVLKGNCETSKLNEEYKYICDPYGYFALLVIQPDLPFPFFSNTESLGKLPFGRIVEECGIEIPDSVNYIKFIEMEENITAVIVSLKRVYSQKMIKEELFLYASNIRKQVKQDREITIAIAITNTSTGVEGLATLYKKAVKTLQKHIFYGRGKIFLHDESEVSLIEDSSLLEEFRKSLTDEMDRDDPALFLSSIDRIFNTIIEKKDVWLLNNVCGELVKWLDKLLLSKTVFTFESFVQRNPGCTEYWYSVNGINKWFKSTITDIMHEIKNTKTDNVSNITRQVIHYIEKYYGEELTVERIAETLGISRVYLGQLFKKETGFTLLEYLTTYRINIAKRMLSNGSYKIYEVAEKIGYRTSQYFSEVFRKMTGMNPLDYKDGVGNYENKH